MIRIVLIVVGFYLAYAGVAFLLQRRLMYPGTFMSPVREVRVDTLPEVEQLWLDNGRGRSEAWLLEPGGPAAAATGGIREGGSGPGGDAAGAPSQGNPAPAVLFFHGNGEFIDGWLAPFRQLARRGVFVLLVEYPGYGRSTGSPTKESIMRAALEGYDRLARQEGVDPDRIVAFGRSLGGGVAAELVQRRPVAALILQSTFTSAGAMAGKAYFLPPFLLRDRFAPLRILRTWDGPTLVLHGREDGIVPFTHGERLAAASEQARFVPMECGHNDCPPSFDDYWDRIVQFLQESLGWLSRSGRG